MTDDTEFFDGVVGGAKLVKDDVREKSPSHPLVVSSALDRRIAQILFLHPELKLRFRSNDVARLDDATKEVLLAKLQKALGIKPLKK